MVALSRQIMEDVRSVPFGSLETLDGFDTEDPGSLPDDEPQREIARRWRYAVAGEGDGWQFGASEAQAWTTFAGSGFDARARVGIAQPTTSTRAVTVTMSLAGRKKDFRLATLISRTEP
jgi:hypothetical protein